MRPKILTVPNFVAAAGVFSTVLAAIQALTENVTGAVFTGQAILYYITVYTFCVYLVIGFTIVAGGLVQAGATFVFGEPDNSVGAGIGAIAGAAFGLYAVYLMLRNDGMAFEKTDKFGQMAFALAGAAILIGTIMVYQHYQRKKIAKASNG